MDCPVFQHVYLWDVVYLGVYLRWLSQDLVRVGVYYNWDTGEYGTCWDFPGQCVVFLDLYTSTMLTVLKCVNLTEHWSNIYSSRLLCASSPGVVMEVLI